MGGKLMTYNLLEETSINLNTTEKIVILMGLRLLSKKQEENIYKKLVDDLIEKISDC